MPGTPPFQLASYGNNIICTCMFAIVFILHLLDLVITVPTTVAQNTQATTEMIKIICFIFSLLTRIVVRACGRNFLIDLRNP